MLLGVRVEGNELTCSSVASFVLFCFFFFLYNLIYLPWYILGGGCTQFRALCVSINVGVFRAPVTLSFWIALYHNVTSCNKFELTLCYSWNDRTGCSICK